MTNERIALAIRRVDRALARIEASTDRIAAKPDPASAELAQRHERLRARTRDAIEAIDRLTGKR